VAPSKPPTLVVLIDVEEEFDWNEEFDRAATRFEHIDALERAVDTLATHGVTPVGVMTYPAVESKDVARRLAGMVSDGRMIAGTHLHPWVTPPHDERVDRHNSFPGNLPVELEDAKLERLTARLEERLGVRPRIYQAGRYGVGPNTSSLLEARGYSVGMSVNPPFDFTAQGGPDWSNYGPSPFWFGAERPLLELPITGAFVGLADGAAGRRLHQFATSPALRPTRLAGMLARLGVVERIRLSPEGQSVEDMKRLTRALFARGERVFVFSFHSPSLSPGCTEYVRTADDLDAFLGRCSGFIDWFVDELGGETKSPIELYDALLAESPPA